MMYRTKAAGAELMVNLFSDLSQKKDTLREDLCQTLVIRTS